MTLLVGTNGPVVLEPNLIADNVITAYGGDVRIKFDPALHKYTVSDVRVQGGAWLQVPSVTTVLGKMLDKKQLVPWATKLSMQEFLKRVEEGKAYSRRELDAIGFQLKDAHKVALDQAGKTGALVHSWLEKYIIARGLGAGFPAPPADTQVRACCSAGRKWIIENDVKPMAIEQILFSRKHRVIGTMDLAASLIIDGRTAVCDYKSSNRLHRSYGLQLAAYRAMLREQTGVEAQDRWLIRLDKTDGTFHPEQLSLDTADAEAEAFFAMVSAYRKLNDLEFFEE